MTLWPQHRCTSRFLRAEMTRPQSPAATSSKPPWIAPTTKNGSDPPRPGVRRVAARFGADAQPAAAVAIPATVPCPDPLGCRQSGPPTHWPGPR